MITLSYSSSPSDTDRGQTEPLAALIAVSTIAIAIGVYGGYFTDVLHDDTARDVSEPTLSNVWHNVGEDGVYEDGELENTAIPPTQLPTGYNVYANVTVLKASGWTEVEAVAYADDGTASRSSLRVSTLGSTARTASRSIAYRTGDGEVRSARLNVVVWKE